MWDQIRSKVLQGQAADKVASTKQVKPIKIVEPPKGVETPKAAESSIKAEVPKAEV